MRSDFRNGLQNPMDHSIGKNVCKKVEKSLRKKLILRFLFDPKRRGNLPVLNN